VKLQDDMKDLCYQYYTQINLPKLLNRGRSREPERDVKKLLDRGGALEQCNWDPYQKTIYEVVGVIDIRMKRIDARLDLPSPLPLPTLRVILQEQRAHLDAVQDFMQRATEHLLTPLLVPVESLLPTLPNLKNRCNDLLSQCDQLRDDEDK
jgi:hypothetical protein